MKYLKIFVIFTIFSLFFACSKSDEVVVKAGSSKLTKKELQEDIKSLPPQTKAFLASPEGVNRLKDELIKREVLYEEAKKKIWPNQKNLKEEWKNSKRLH